jgi:transcriptional regulator with XRE-family HTH domain
MSDNRSVDDLDVLEPTLTPEEREEVAAASVALDLARLVFAAREQRGLTQAQAAECTGVQQQMISRLEGGTAQPTFKTVERYLRRLGFAVSVSLIDLEQGQIVDHVMLNEETHAAGAAEFPADEKLMLR